VRSTFLRGLLVAALAIPLSGGAQLASAPTAAAAGTPNITLAKTMPAQALLGATIPVRITASNTTATDGYNLGITDTLPAGVGFANASPAPDRVIDRPNGTTVLIWDNIADLLRGTTESVSYDMVPIPGDNPISSTVRNSARAYVQSDPRVAPLYTDSGAAVPGTTTGNAAAQAATEIIPFTITKAEPSPEFELVRGVHDNKTVYTLTVQNNAALASNGFSVVDYLPAGLEYLGCGTVDNSAAGTVEHPARTRIDDYPAPATANPCPTASSVTTVTTDPDGSGPMPNGVYTRVEWNSAALAAALPGGAALGAGSLFRIDYVAAIPLRRNVQQTLTNPTANLDNNTGQLTADEDRLRNYAVATGTTGGTTYTDEDTLEVTAEDIAIQKSVDAERVTQGSTSTWTLDLQTSEYVNSTDAIVVTDTLPTSLDLTGSTPAATSVVTQGNGTQLVTWRLPAATAPNAIRTITVTTRVRETYRGGGPVSANDTWTNTVAVTTNAVIVTANDGSTTSSAITDESEVSQSTGGLTLDKQVSEPVAGTLTCGDGTGVTFTPDLASGPYRPGDRVCWRVTVTFPNNLDTRAPALRDFLPPGFSYESYQLTPANTVPVSNIAFTDESPVLRWNLNDVDPSGVRFEVVVSTRITDPGAVASGDTLANLAKMAYRNTSGGVFQLREKADAPYIEAQLTLEKSATPTTATGGDPVRYTVRVPNSGGLDASNTSVRDLLPPGVTCVDVATLGGATCTDGPSGSYLQWDGVTVPAGGAVTLDYDVLLPGSFAPGAGVVNTAGVRSYQNPSNWDSPFTLVPADNIDPTLTPNTDPATATATVQVPDATLEKVHTTSRAEAGNAGENQATIGEIVTYTVTATVPAGTTITNGRLRDVLPAGLTVVGVPSVQLNGGALPPAFTTTTSPTEVGVDFPSPYANPAADGDDVLTVEYQARVVDTGGPVRGDDVTNTAAFTFDGADLAASTTTGVVEPQLETTKTSSDADGAVTPGQDLTYSISVGNGSAAGVSTAHDIVITDVVPAGVTPLDGTGNPAADGATLPSGGVWSAGPRTIVWEVASLLPGATAARGYAARVDDPLLVGASITNRVTATATSLPGADPDEATAASGRAGYQATGEVTLTGPVFSVAKSAAPTPVTIGQPTTYTVDVTIPAQVEGRDVTVLDALPPGMSFEGLVSTTCTGCPTDLAATALSVTGATGTIGFFLGDITASSTERVVQLQYTAYPNGAVREDATGDGDVLVNRAQVYFNTTDTIIGTPPGPPAAGDFDDSSAPSSASVELDEPALAIDKDVAGQNADDDTRRATPGDRLTYQVTVRNTGTWPAYDITVADATDRRFIAFVDTTDTAQAGGVALTDGTVADGTLAWQVTGPLAPGAAVTVSYQVTVPADLDQAAEVPGPELPNTADVPSYYGLPEAERTVPGRTYPRYDDVTPDDVGIELDLASIGDRVWFDVDGDGVQDSGEPPLAGVPVTITYLGADGVPGGGDDEVRTATTDANGTYLVDYLPGGAYTVVVDTAATPITSRGLVPGYDLDDGTAGPDGRWPGTLGEAEAKRDVDFGFTGSGAVGDTVFVDLDRSGAQGAGEPGIPGVGVTLVWGGPDGDVSTTGDNLTYRTTTDADGRYRLDGLPAGAFTVTVDPASLDPSYTNVTDPDGGNDNRAALTLPAGGSDLDQDFGYAGSGAIGDTVWLDRDGDGIQDAGEPGLQDVTVELTFTGPNGETTTLSTITGPDGAYLVDNLPAGRYTVRVGGGLPGGLENTGDPDGGGDSASSLILGNGQRNLAQDFGYRATSLLGDRVWWDVDDDGVQDAGEPGIPGVEITATGPNGVTFTTTTRADGSYAFRDLQPGQWTVRVTGGVPGGAVPTFDADSGTAGPDGTSVTTLAVADLDQDFGYRGAASLGDTIWLDRNGDGAQDSGEPGLAGARVVLVYAGADGDLSTTADNVEFVTTTGADGTYAFTNLPAGTFTVIVDRTTLPPGVAATVDRDGGEDSTTRITLVGGQRVDDVDFGYRGTASVGDTIWWDRDGDGTQDTTGGAAEPGLDGVTVRVTWAGLDGDLATTADNEVFTAITAANGTYRVEGLPAGRYGVAVDTTTLPAAVVNTADEDGNLDSVTTVDLSAGEAHRTADFGYRGSASVGDTVYLDLDGDGSAGPGEPGVPGQRVDLTWAGPDGAFGTGDDLTLTTTTDGSGRYGFDALPAGDYRVRVVGGVATAANTADPDGGSDSVSALTLATGQADLDQDFGYRGPNSLGDTVWWDLDADGTDDGATGEPRLAGVATVVTWLGPDGVVGGGDDVVIPSAVTDAGGRYRVDGLPDGTYLVQVTGGVPAGLMPSYDADGGAVRPNGASVTTLRSVGGEPDVDLDQDFGYAGGGAIGDTVWLDLDRDGSRDVGEPGLAGATVTLIWAGPDGDLLTTADNRVVTTTVDANGQYLVDNLPAGEFSVVVSGLPAGVGPTRDPDGGADSTSRVTLAPGARNPDQDFGYAGSAGVGDTVFLDVDGDGAQDPTEPGLAGVRVRVATAGADGLLGTADDVTVTVTTDADGRYLVGGLPAGPTGVSYDRATLPAGVVPAGDLDGAEPASTVVTLEDGATRRDADFSARGTSTVTGQVWVDTDRDGVRDPRERGIPGVTVVVTWQGPDGPIVRRVTTDANGRWSIEDAPSGSWSAVVDPATLPAGLVPTTPRVDNASVPPGGTGQVVHGFVAGATVGDRVWRDLDRDGRQDPGEPGVAGVLVHLVDTDGTVVATTRTDANGTYRFVGVPPGDYTVRVVPASLPDGLAFTTSDAWSVSLSPGEERLTADFGLAPPGPGSLGGRGPLASTGGTALGAALAGGLLLLTGGALVLLARRRLDSGM
jgi:large repetitive protein